MVHPGYGFQLDWERMAEGIEHVNGIYQRLKKRIEYYLELFDLISLFSAPTDGFFQLAQDIHAQANFKTG